MGVPRQAQESVCGELMSERAEVKRDGSKAQKNSGRGAYQKGDAKWKNCLVDYKEASVWSFIEEVITFWEENHE